MKKFTRLKESKCSMLNTKVFIILFLLLMSFLLPTQVVKAQGADYGRKADKPFPIYTYEQLKSLANCVNSDSSVFYYRKSDNTFYVKKNFSGTEGVDYWKYSATSTDVYYKLMEDIRVNPDSVDVSGCDGRSAGITAWTPIGNKGKKFRGHFDGDYHLISGVFVNNPNIETGTGLFGAITDNAEVKNLGLVNSYINGGSKVGGIVGELVNSNVRHCFVDATIVASKDNHAGGIVGYAYCTSTTDKAQIDSCYAAGSVSSSYARVGGLCGSSNNVRIISCYSSAVINNDAVSSGALLGKNDGDPGDVINCYYDSQMCGQTNNIGTGMSTAELIDPSWSGLGTNFSYSYSGSLDNYYPYLNGFDANNIWVRFSTLPISFAAGQNAGNVTENFYLGGTHDDFVWTSSAERYVKVVGSTAEVYMQGWSLLKVTHTSDTTLKRSLAIYINKTPLIGTAANPFTIDNFDDLVTFRKGINSGTPFEYKHFTVNAKGANTYFLQTEDIEIYTNINWNASNGYRIGNTFAAAFAGTYDGGHHELRNMKNNPSDYISAGGLFGYVNHGTVKNLGVTIAEFVGDANSGVICGQPMNAVFDSCYVAPGNNDTIVFRGANGGALFGYAAPGTDNDDKIDTLIIRNCYNLCHIALDRFSDKIATEIGGIIGFINNTKYVEISNCYNKGDMNPRGDVRGPYLMGGICGYMKDVVKADIIRCHNHGDVISKRGISANNQNSNIFSGGILGRSYLSFANISYCYNTGNVTSGNSAAGILGYAASNNGLVDHCYNTGDISVVEVGQPEVNRVYGIAAAVKVTSSLNMGNVTALRSASAYGIGSGQVYDCFNAGTISSPWGYVFPLNNSDGLSGTDRNINVGRSLGPASYGTDATSGKNIFYDKQMAPDVNFASRDKFTSDMLGDALSTQLGDNWIYEAGMYPRIKGLDTTAVMKVAASPVILAGGDNVKAVTTNFSVGGCNSVEWSYNNDGFVALGTCGANTQEATVLSEPVAGATVLTASLNGFEKKVVLTKKITCQKDTLIVHDLAQLKALRDGVNSGVSFNYVDINGDTVAVPVGAEGVTFLQDTLIDMSSETDWENIGTSEFPFRGVYDGGGDTLTGLTQNNQAVGGLFGYTKFAKIQNLTLAEVHISGTSSNTGALISRSYGDTLSSCVVISGTVEGFDKASTNNTKPGVAGLIGYANRTLLTNCGNYASVTGYSNTVVGGLVGRTFYTTTLNSCFNYGEIKGGCVVGGLAGMSAEISNSYNAGDVTGTSGVSYVGGIVGSTDESDGLSAWTRSIAHSFNTGHVTAIQPASDSYMGGIVGYSSRLKIEYCYNTGIVNGSTCQYVGGICGHIKGYVQYCYVANTVSGSGDRVGAILGNGGTDNTVFQYNYYDKNLCQIGGVAGEDMTTLDRAVGKSTADMVNQKLLEFSAVDWTFADGFYPRVKSMDNLDASLASAAMLDLGSQKSTSVTVDFGIGGCSDGVTWSLESGNSIDFDNGDCLAAVIGKGAVYAQASKNGVIYKDIKLFVGISDSLPLFIKSKEELVNFRNLINSGATFYYNENDSTYHATGAADDVVIANQGENLYFKLLVDVDLSDQGSWTPIGNNTVPFKGNFNGGDKNISGLQLTTDGDYRGLFGCLEGGSIKQLNITKAKISGSGSYNALLCGCNNLGFIINCNLAADTILATDNTVGNSTSWGGICGLNTGVIQECTSTGDTIYSDKVRRVAAICGAAYNGKIEDCTVSDLKLQSVASATAGVVGFVKYNNIRNCKVINSTFVFAGDYCGGICGCDTLSNINGCVFRESFIRSSAGLGTGGIAGYALVNNSTIDNPSRSGLYITYCVSEGGAIIAERPGGESRVGGIVGFFNGNSKGYLSNCANHTPVTGKGAAGGLVGFSNGVYTDSCYNTAPIVSYSSSYCGGLVGYTGSSTGHIFYSFNLGSVTGKDYTGGLTGRNYYTSIMHCFNAGSVTGEDQTGGLVGYELRSTCYSYNAGQVKGTVNVGGIAGLRSKDNSPSSSYGNYNIGWVQGISRVGAVYGYVYEEMMGYVSKNYYDKQFSNAVGINGEEISGKAEGKLTSEMLGESLKNLLTGLSSDDAEYRDFSDASRYPQVKALKNSSWAGPVSLTTTTPIFMPDNYTAWTIPVGINDGSVYGRNDSGVKWTAQEGGNNLTIDNSNVFSTLNIGNVEVAASFNDVIYKRVRMRVGNSEDHPIEIKNYSELSKFRDFINAGKPFYYDTASTQKTFYANQNTQSPYVEIPAGGEGLYFRLTDVNSTINIILGTSNWAPIGRDTAPFKGYFDGANHILSNMQIDGDSYLGFFGYSTGSIKNLTIDRATVHGRSYVGALCGYNEGVVNNCGALNGSVISYSDGEYVGGLIGKSYKGFISACYNANTVGHPDILCQYIGGIAGVIVAGKTNTSFNMGRVTTAGQFVGGITGWNTSNLYDCYNTGIVTGLNFVGGITGRDSVIASIRTTRVYNAGEVIVTGKQKNIADANLYYGGILHVYNSTGINDPTNSACDLVMSPEAGVVRKIDNGQGKNTMGMTGDSLKSILGTEKWTYGTDMQYPRLTVLCNSAASEAAVAASYASTAVVKLNFGDKENVNKIGSDFTVYHAEDTVVWDYKPETNTSVLDITTINSNGEVKVTNCGEITLTVSSGTNSLTATREIDFSASNTISQTTSAVTCGEPYLWELNHLYYTKSGSYSESVSLGTGCDKIVTLELYIPDTVLKVRVDHTDISCHGENNGKAKAIVEGSVKDYQYMWTSTTYPGFSSTADSVSNLEQGDYKLVVTDGNGCQDSVEFTIEEPAPLTITNLTIDSRCYGKDDGVVSFDISGGKAPYTIEWTNPALGSETLGSEGTYTKDDLADDTYTIEVKDDNDCPQSLQDVIVAGDTTKYVIAAFGIDKPYDAVAVAPNTYTLTIGDGAAETLTSGQAKLLDNGDTLKVTLSTNDIDSQKDVCSIDNNFSSVVILRGTDDVTCRYNIDTIPGIVKINKLSVTLTSRDTTVDYETQTYAENHNVDVSGDGFADGEGIESYGDWAIQNGIGQTKNTFGYTLKAGTNPDNYTIDTVYGYLTVSSSGSVIVRVDTLEKTYDGTALPGTVRVLSLPDETFSVNIKVAVSGSTVDTLSIAGLTNNNTPTNPNLVHTPTELASLITNAGSVTLTIIDVKIFENGNDITSNYADTQKVVYPGRLTVKPREITLKSNNGGKVYDGAELSDHDVTVLGDASNNIFTSQISGLTASAETPVINYTPTPVPNLISFTKKAEYIDDNYLITYDTGKLSITKRTVTYRGDKDEKDYTGAEQCIDAFYVDTLTEGTFKLAEGHTMSTVTYSACGDTAGKYAGTFTGLPVVISDALGQPVTDNYNMVFTPDTLVIKTSDKPLVIKSLFLTNQPYDGNNHTKQEYEVTYDGNPITADATGKVFDLGNGDMVTITPTGTGVTGVTHVAEGPVYNLFNYTITNAAGNDVSSNYNLQRADTGTLSLEPRAVIITTLPNEKPYDGQAFRYDTCAYRGYGFVQGEGILTPTWHYMDAQPPCIDAGKYPNIVDSVKLNANTVESDYAISYYYDTLNIKKVDATVTAQGTSVYGDTIRMSYTISGFISGETEESVRADNKLWGHPGLETVATESSDANLYPITVNLDTFSAKNYNFRTAATNNYIIQYRPVTITANDVTANYTGYEHSYTEGPEPRYSCDNGGLRIGDTIQSLTMDCTNPRMAGTALNAISITDVVITNANGDVVTGNYDIQKNAGAFIIAKKDLKLKVSDGTIEYDGAAHAGDALTAPQYTIDAVDGLAETDTISVLNFTGGGTTYSSDPYAVSIDTASLVITNREVGMSRNMKDNYNITIDTGYVTITKNTKEITVASGSQSFDYDGTAHTFPSYTVTYDGIHVDSLATDSTMFVLPTGDTLTMTPTASITVAAAGGVENTFDVNLTNAASYALQIVQTYGQLTMNTLPPISITSRDAEFTYDGQLHIFNRYIVVFDGDTLNPDNGTDTVFTIPANGHKVKITPTFAGITNFSENSEHNNLFDRTVEDVTGNPALSSYMAVYDTFGTVRIAPLTGVEVTVKEHGMETTYDGYEQRVHGYDVSINNSLYTELDFHYKGPEADTIAKGRYKGVYPMNIKDTDFVNDNGNFDGVAFTIEDSSLVIKANPTVITLTAGSAEKLDDGNPLECTTFTYTPDNALTDVIAEGDSLVVELSGILYGVGETESEIVGYMVIRDTSRNATMVRKSITVPTGYVDVTDNYTIEVSPEKGKLAIYEALSLTVDSLSDPLCPGSEEGYVRLKVSGGKPATPKYNYQIVGNVTHDNYSGTSDSIITLTSLKADTYTVTVKESLDSMITTNFEIKERDVLTTANSIFKCPVDIDTVLKNGGCTLTLMDLGTPEFSTTTSIPMSEITIYNNAPEGNIFKAGETTVVTWVVKSLCGDSLTCDQNIKVSFQVCPDAVDHEGTHYPSVRLGCKCWTTENLKSTEYSDGRAIDNVMDYYSPEHPNTTENVNIFGHLYDWYAAADTQRYGSVDSVESAYRLGHRIQGICPEGWYLPSDQDFEELNVYPTTDLRSTSHWLPINGVTNTNATGFNSLPGGMYNCSTGRYENMEGGSYYWTCHPVYDLSTGAMIDYICEKIVNKDYSRCSGFSIRCVYDEH